MAQGPTTPKEWAEAGGGCVILLVILVAAWWFLWPEPAPVTLATSDSQVKAVAHTGTSLTIDVELREHHTNQARMLAVAAVMQSITEALQAGAPDAGNKPETLLVRFTMPTIDRLGNETRSGLLNLQFIVADLKKANVDNLAPVGILNLATAVNRTTGLGRDVASSFCAEPTWANAADAFCRQADR